MDYWHNKSIDPENETSIIEFIDLELKFFKEKLEITKTGKFEKEFLVVIKKIFLTPPLKNLHNRIQLGLLHLVKDEWNQVKHTRLEHSIGVTIKCLVVCDLLNRKQKDIFTFDDVFDLIISAAIHDIAHLPISHATERGILTTGKFNDGISHEDRVASFLLSDNDFFEPIKTILKDAPRKNLNETIINIISIISYKSALKYLNPSSFKWPKKAITQLLSSELDLDRLDFLMRDSIACNYTPVTLILDDVLKYLHGICVKPMTLVDKTIPFGEFELCLESKYLECAFHFLVSRVLLYKNIYFSKKVRQYEANLTTLISELVLRDVPLKIMSLVNVSDENFIQDKLNEYLEDYNLLNDSNELVNTLVANIREKKTEAFRYVSSIKSDMFKNPRLKNEFLKNIDSRYYIDELKKEIISYGLHNGIINDSIKEHEVLFDIFSLKAGIGNFLIEDAEAEVFSTLKDHMNGSNMHRICSETRIDVYVNPVFGDNSLRIKDCILEFCNK